MSTQDNQFDPARDLIHADTAGNNLHEAYPNLFETPAMAKWFQRKRDEAGWGGCFQRIGKQRLMLNKVEFSKKLQADAGVIIV